MNSAAGAGLTGMDANSVVLRHSLSLDGYGAVAPGVPEDVLVEYDEDEEFIAYMGDLLGRAGVHAMGSKTYGDMAGYWPYRTGPEADAMNRIPKVVFSRRPIETPWDATTVCSGDLAAEIGDLKERGAGPIMVHGGVRFAQAVVAADLVDEYHLMVGPVAYGAGGPLFTAFTRLKLVDVRSFPRGNVALIYVRPDAG